MNTLLLDIIVPGSKRGAWRHPGPDFGTVIGKQQPETVTDSLNNNGNTVIDSVQQATDQVTDTLTQTQSVLLDSGFGGISPTVWTIAIAVVALLACLSLAVAYRRRTLVQA